MHLASDETGTIASTLGTGLASARIASLVGLWPGTKMALPCCNAARRRNDPGSRALTSYSRPARLPLMTAVCAHAPRLEVRRACEDCIAGYGHTSCRTQARNE
jgi:hypothetical protein